jgi:hypothetical protein
MKKLARAAMTFPVEPWPAMGKFYQSTNRFVRLGWQGREEKEKE